MPLPGLGMLVATQGNGPSAWRISHQSPRRGRIKAAESKDVTSRRGTEGHGADQGSPAGLALTARLRKKKREPDGV